MNDGRKQICIHFILDGKMYTKRYEYHPPCTGDEIRIGGADNEQFFVIGKRVWVYDEPENPMSRLNVEITAAS